MDEMAPALAKRWPYKKRAALYEFHMGGGRHVYVQLSEIGDNNRYRRRFLHRHSLELLEI
jgi:hypothetical protein